VSEPILRLSAVTKEFGGLTAVDNVDFSVAEGELRCLIGPNGAGKSTIFRMVTGVYHPTRGRIFYKGSALGNTPSFKRARMGISIKFQTPMVYYDQPLMQNLIVALQRFHGPAEARIRADGIMEDFGIADAAGKPAIDVAHGYRQWLEIGMAVASSPKLLLLDEPTAGMSAEETAKTARLVHKLADGGMTVIVIDHDIEFVRMLNCNLTVLHLGRLFAEGTLDEIQADDGVRAIYLGKK
jgi:branched-chain amino acid transport system ATP-binding protein